MSERGRRRRHTNPHAGARGIYRRRFRDLEFYILSALGYAQIWGKGWVYLGLRVTLGLSETSLSSYSGFYGVCFFAQSPAEDGSQLGTFEMFQKILKEGVHPFVV